MRIGVLISGGDCPGINAAIWSICKSAAARGMEVMGIQSGFLGLLTKEAEIIRDRELSGLLSLGGAILGTSREKPFKKGGIMPDTDKPTLMLQNIQELQLDAIVCIGGNGTLETAAKMVDLGIDVVCFPKTIDNDIPATDLSFGFDSAVTIATDAIDRLNCTASSHKRVMVIEVMGAQTGWIALHSGMAGAADVILLPEHPYDISVVGDALLDRFRRGRPSSVVVVAEGIAVSNNRKRAGEFIAEEIEYETGIETRQTVLGYIQRGGTPTPLDRNLATRLGCHAVELIASRRFGRMVALQGGKICSVPIKDIAGKVKRVPTTDDLLLQGRQIGTCFG